MSNDKLPRLMLIPAAAIGPMIFLLAAGSVYGHRQDLPSFGGVIVRARAACKAAVREQLPAPETAEWPGIFSEDGWPKRTGRDAMWIASVGYRNLSNVPLRGGFLCAFDGSTGIATATVH